MSPMHIAVAGGSSAGLGTSVTTALLAAGYKVTILSRSTPSGPITTPNLTQIAVDYTSVSSVSGALTGVHTLISVLWSFTDIIPINQTLIDGAVAAGVKRFIPSEWSGREECNNLINWYGERPQIIDMVKASGMEYTCVRVGIFMNYLGAPKVDALAGLRNMKVIVDIENATANIPGTGNELLGFMRVEDVGKVTAKIVALDKWEKECLITGDMTTYNAVVKIAEEVTGRKFNVNYAPLEFYQDEKNTPEHDGARFEFQYKKCVASGLFSFTPSKVNSEAGPLMTCKEFITKWWSADSKQAKIEPVLEHCSKN